MLIFQPKRKGNVATPVRIVFSTTTYPFLHLYEIQGGTLVGLPDLANPPNNGSGRSLSVSPDGKFLWTPGNIWPMGLMYGVTSTGFTKLFNAQTSNPEGSAFSSDSVYFALARGDGRQVDLYKRAGNTFALLPYGNVPSLPSSGIRSVSFSPNGSYLALGGAADYSVRFHKRNGDTFALIGAPPIHGEINDLKFSPDSTYLAVANRNIPGPVVLKRYGDSLSVLNSPSLKVNGECRAVSFSPDGNHLAVAHQDAPYLTIYGRIGDVFTPLGGVPSIAGPANGVCYSPDGKYLSVSHYNSPYMSVLERNGESYTKLPNPSKLLPSVAFSCVVIPNAPAS